MFCKRRCLVHVCPNSAREATEDLGATLAAHTQAPMASAQQTQTAHPQRFRPHRACMSVGMACWHTPRRRREHF